MKAKKTFTRPGNEAELKKGAVIIILPTLTKIRNEARIYSIVNGAISHFKYAGFGQEGLTDELGYDFKNSMHKSDCILQHKPKGKK